jgi:hypothetical protein
MDGTARRRTIHRAVTIVTTSMTGVSISSAILAPTRGTTHSVRIVPTHNGWVRLLQITASKKVFLLRWRRGKNLTLADQ